ncbi:hypothetical protein [Methanoregula sp.]|uniref:hypothetical protein n=1 Tax=Methanoregula sp. TaxID=2052170 RepID=UPI003C5FFFD7
MMERARVIFLLLLLVGCALLVAGCTTPRMGDTHNTTVVIQSYNTWADQQVSYSKQVSSTLNQIGNTLNEYNHETANDPSDPGTLQGDVASDGQAINQWGSASTTLGSATNSFSSDTASLSFGNDTETSRLTGLLLQEMKIYSIDMKNAQQHFVDYNRDLSGYLSEKDPDYRDDSLRMAAMDAKSQALLSISDGDNALSNITATAKILQQEQ